MYKYVPYDPAGHRQPVTDPNDYIAYACIISRVRCPKAAAIARFGEDCIRRLIDLGVLDNVLEVGRGWWLEVPLKDVNKEYD